MSLVRVILLWYEEDESLLKKATGIVQTFLQKMTGIFSLVFFDFVGNVFYNHEVLNYVLNFLYILRLLLYVTYFWLNQDLNHSL